jgi:Glyoxalase-like domain
MALTLDHIVIGAADLDHGRRWALERLGADPVQGGRHILMGTHNLLLRLDDSEGRDRYLEIIAIDPDAAEPTRPRWFDLDQPRVRAALAQEPALVAWVARSDDLDGDRQRLAAAGLDPGHVVDASRETADGPLRWRITIPADGARVARGAVPMLISWLGRRPAASLPASGVSLDRLTVRGLGDSPAAELLSGDAMVGPGSGPALEVALRSETESITLPSIG